MDYTVSYQKNNAVGTATATLTGNGTTFRGSATTTFRINVEALPMFRLYNRWSGEHLFTMDNAEVKNLTPLGWTYEGVAWQTPSWSDTPVYRLYNHWSGDHFYAANHEEYEHLHSLDWSQEGIAFFSADKDTGAPIYRLFNKWLARGTHLFTTDKSEYDNLVKIGRSGEGIAFRAME